MSLRMHRRNRSRGATLIEFLFVVPALMGLILLSVDMGRMAQAYGALADAAASSANAGAQLGVPGDASAGTAAETFTQAFDQLPLTGQFVDRLVSVGTAPGPTVGPTSGADCSQARPYVVVHAELDVSFVTPGLGGLLSMFSEGPGPDTGEWTLSTNAAALCQIAPRA